MREIRIPLDLEGSNSEAYSDVRDPADSDQPPEPAVRNLMRLRRMGHEGTALDGVSPALRAWASDFSLRGQRKVTKRKANPAYSPD